MTATATATASTPATATSTPATMAQLRATFPEVFSAPDLTTLATSPKGELTALSAVREWVAVAHSGSDLRPLPEKTVKGAALPLTLARTLRAMAPAKNAHRGAALVQWGAIVEEWMFLAATAGIKPATLRPQRTELEKARAYIAGLSPETMSALRAEGVI